MEDDEETQSHPSPETGSPSSPQSNGRITVTVAAAPPQNTLTLALPIQQPRSSGGVNNGGGGGGGGREDCWSEGATSVLIDAWGERYLELSRGNLKQKHWKEVADIVSSREHYTKIPKTDIQCKNRIDTVKKKYKVEKSKIACGGGPSKWPFFERLEHLIGPTAAKVGSGSTPNQKVVPVGIPVGVSASRSTVSHFQNNQKPVVKPNQKLKQKQKLKKPQFGRYESESSRSEPEPPSPDSIDSFPPPVPKRPRVLSSSAVRPAVKQESKDAGGGGVGERDKNSKSSTDWGNSVRELTRAILKFGEAYEQAESSKLQQMVEMEKQRMKFTKDLELQRMQFFMKTQLEISQLKHRRPGNNSNHHSNHNNNIVNNSDSSS